MRKFEIKHDYYFDIARTNVYLDRAFIYSYYHDTLRAISRKNNLNRIKYTLRGFKDDPTKYNDRKELSIAFYLEKEFNEMHLKARKIMIKRKINEL